MLTFSLMLIFLPVASLFPSALSLEFLKSLLVIIILLKLTATMKNMLAMLLILEVTAVLAALCLVTCIALKESTFSSFIVFLSVAVSGAAAALSLLVSVIREFGSALSCPPH